MMSSATNHVYNHSSYGPCFGSGHDLHINNTMKSGSQCYTIPCTYRSHPSGYEVPAVNGTLLAGANLFNVEEIEVFAVSNYGCPLF
jgi:hypothetical protein